MLLNLVIPFSACGDVRVLPSGNQTLVFQNGEVIFQALSEFLVLVGVRVKHLDGRGIGVVFECGHRSPSRLGLREDTYRTTTSGYARMICVRSWQWSPTTARNES